MKLLFSITLFVFVLANINAIAQENSLPGYVKIVNLVSTESPTRIQIGEIKLNNDEPIEPGLVSGNMGLLPGDYSFTVKNPGTKPDSAKDTFTLEPGKTVMIVFYTEVKEFKNGDIEHKLRYTKMTRELDMDKPKLSVVSLAQANPTLVKLGTTPLTLTPEKAYVHPVELEDTFQLKQGELELGLIEILSPIHYLAFVYDNPATSSLGMTLVEHSKIAYDPPKEKFDDEEEDANADEEKTGAESAATTQEGSVTD